MVAIAKQISTQVKVTCAGVQSALKAGNDVFRRKIP